MRTGLPAALLLAAVASAAASDPLPPVSPDGLVLQEPAATTAVYVKPGASLEGYREILLLDCAVAFHPDWQREHNARAHEIGRPVTDRDMLRMREALAVEFRRVFTEVLTAGDGFPVVSEPGADVLTVKPAIVNLVVTLPAARPGNRQYSNLTSAGAMTLYAELYDSVSGAILARVIAPEVSRNANFEMQDARVVNGKEADEILRQWASALRARLPPSAPPANAIQ